MFDGVVVVAMSQSNGPEIDALEEIVYLESKRVFLRVILIISIISISCKAFV